MPMPANRQEALEREARVWRLRVRGWTQQRIADDVGISQSAVHKILERREAKLHEQLAEEAKPIKARHTAQLEYIQEEAMEAWERSKLDAETTRTVEKAIAQPQGHQEPQPQGGTLTRTNREPLPEGLDAEDPQVLMERTTTSEAKGQSGDPRHLETARKAMADIRSIWGIDAPAKTELSGPAGGAISLQVVRSLNNIYGDPKPGDESEGDAVPAAPDFEE